MIDSALLARFDGLMVDEHHRALARRALDWSLQRAVAPDPREHAKEAFLASTFEVFCEPPLATLEESFLSIKFLLFFFKADDASEAVLDELVPLLDGQEGARPGSAASVLKAYYDELIADLRSLRRDPKGFQDSLRRTCLSMQVEKRADKATMTEAEFRRLRGEVAAVAPYVECWQTIRGICFSPALDEALRRSAILAITSELVYLVNDLGSFDRDQEAARVDPHGADPNIVLIRMRTLRDPEAARSEVIALHDARIADFQRAERRLLASEHGSDPALHAYLTLLRCTVKGNLTTTRHLGPLRYKGATETLSRLLTL